MTWLSATIPSLLAVRPTRRAHVRGLLPLLALVALGLAFYLLPAWLERRART